MGLNLRSNADLLFTRWQITNWRCHWYIKSPHSLHWWTGHWMPARYPNKICSALALFFFLLFLHILRQIPRHLLFFCKRYNLGFTNVLLFRKRFVSSLNEQTYSRLCVYFYIKPRTFVKPTLLLNNKWCGLFFSLVQFQRHNLCAQQCYGNWFRTEKRANNHVSVCIIMSSNY